MMRALFLTLMSAISLMSAAATAADLKVAVVDMEKIFQEYYKTKISDGNLKKQAEIFKDYSEKLNESLQKLQDEFKSLRDASQNVVLTETERENKRLAAQDKYRQVNAKEAELKQYNREKQRQLRDDYDKMRAEILEEIKKAIKDRCALEGYSLVLDKSGMTLNNIPALIYHNPAMDITGSVIQELNRGHNEKDSKDKDKAEAKETESK